MYKRSESKNLKHEPKTVTCLYPPGNYSNISHLGFWKILFVLGSQGDYNSLQHICIIVPTKMEKDMELIVGLFWEDSHFSRIYFLSLEIPNPYGNMSSPILQFTITSNSNSSNRNSHITNIRPFRVENQHPSAKTLILLALLKLWALSRRLDTADKRPLLDCWTSLRSLKIGKWAPQREKKCGQRATSCKHVIKCIHLSIVSYCIIFQKAVWSFSPTFLGVPTEKSRDLWPIRF